MSRPGIRRLSLFLYLALIPLWVASCPSGGRAVLGGAEPEGTHTVMGRGFFEGGVMILLDARTHEGQTSGTAEHSRVQTGGESTFRVVLDVRCMGVFTEGTVAIVTGPIDEIYGDQLGVASARDWWVIQGEEGGQDGDRILSGQETQDRALTLCQRGPTAGATLKAVDGNLSILSGGRPSYSP